MFLWEIFTDAVTKPKKGSPLVLITYPPCTLNPIDFLQAVRKIIDIIDIVYSYFDLSLKKAVFGFNGQFTYIHRQVVGNQPGNVA